MAPSDLFSFTQEELISVIEQQHGEIQILLNERSWLQEDSKIQRSQAAECFEKVLKWQEYGNGLTKELEHLRTRDEQWKEALTQAVDKLNTERENYTNLDSLYSSLKEKNKQIKETLESAFILGRGMYEEYCALYYNYTFLLNYAYWIQSGWNEPLAICQGQEEGNPTPPTPAEESVPFTATLPKEGWSAISPNMPTIQSPPKSRLFIRIQCPWDAFVGANANDKVPHMSAIQAPRVLAIEAPCSPADNTPYVADTQTPCLTKIKAPCLPEIEATCLSKDKSLCVADNQTLCVSEVKAPCESGNQALLVQDNEVPSVMENIDTDSAGSAHLSINESLTGKSTSKVSGTKDTSIIIPTIAVFVHVLTCIVVKWHIWWTPFLILLSKEITHGWLEALLDLVKKFSLRSRGLHFTKLWDTVLITFMAFKLIFPQNSL